MDNEPKIIKWEETGWSEDEINNLLIELWVERQKPHVINPNASAIGGPTVTITITSSTNPKKNKT